MKYTTALLFFLLTSFSAFANESILQVNFSDLGISSQQDALINTIQFNNFLKNCNSKQVKINIPIGQFRFRFNAANKNISISNPNIEKLYIEGQGFASILIFDNEMPDDIYDLFQIKYPVQQKTNHIYFSHLQMQGPENPGLMKEKNKVTHAVFIVGGNVNFFANEVKLSKNFFAGIVATGKGDKEIEIKKSEIENYGSIGVGMFGTANKNVLHCFDTKFLRNGLKPSDTYRGKDYGASIYCHPNASIWIEGCSFFRNYRNAIQLTSGTALKHKRFPDPSFYKTEYQKFIGNYFDSTLADGIQLGFYYPFARIENNIFNNALLAVQARIGATIQNNQFNKNTWGIEYRLDFNANDDDSVFVYIKKNQIKGGRGVRFFNTKEAKIYKIFTEENRFKDCEFNVGSAYGGDSSKLFWESIKDTFDNAFVKVAFSNDGIINRAYVKAGKNQFLSIPKEATGSKLLVKDVYVENKKGEDYFILVKGSSEKYADKNAWIELHDVMFKHPVQKAFSQVIENANIHIYFNNKEYSTPLQCKELLGDFTISYDTYKIIGTGSIRTIALNHLFLPSQFSWGRTLDGILILKALDGFRLEPGGNIELQSTFIAKKNTSISLKWNRETQKWNLLK
ncbi:MAG: hypothetical protein R2831_00685 [Chitinophagaceae bacterium]